jgi:excisionase family DNA binding protein
VSDDLPQLLSVRQTAGYLGMGEQTVRDLIGKGEFPVPVRKVGGRLKVAKVALDRWLAEDSAVAS